MAASAALQRACAAAWPATEEVERDGWLLRSTPGLARLRSNGALPLRDGLDVAVVDRFYAERGQPARIQVEPLAQRPLLAVELDRRGWSTGMRVVVHVAEAPDVGAPTEPVALLGAAATRWLDAWARAEERDPGDVAAHARTVFAAVEGRAAWALAPRGLGVGLAVCDPGRTVATVLCLATRREARGQGVATAVLRGLAEWARGEGAPLVAVQVLEGNAPALALYARHGFALHHRYTHRQAPAG